MAICFMLSICRFGCFQKLWSSIDASEPGGVNEFSLSYKKYGLHQTQDGGVRCLEWCPGAKELYLWGDFSEYLPLLLMYSGLILVKRDDNKIIYNYHFREQGTTTFLHFRQLEQNTVSL